MTLHRSTVGRMCKCSPPIHEADVGSAHLKNVRSIYSGPPISTICPKTSYGVSHLSHSLISRCHFKNMSRGNESRRRKLRQGIRRYVPESSALWFWLEGLEVRICTKAYSTGPTGDNGPRRYLSFHSVSRR